MNKDLKRVQDARRKHWEKLKDWKEIKEEKRLLKMFDLDKWDKEQDDAVEKHKSLEGEK